VNEPFFAGHFPDSPLCPACSSSSHGRRRPAVLVLRSIPERDSKIVFLVSVDAARFRKPVVPERSATLEMNMLRRKGSVARLSGRVTVDGVLGGQQRLQQQAWNPPVRCPHPQRPAHSADQRIGVLHGSVASSFDDRQFGPDAGENPGMLHLAGIMICVTLRLQASIRRAEVPERDPVAACGQLLDFARGLLFKWRRQLPRRPVLRAVSSASTGKRPLPAMIPYFHPFSTPRSEEAMNSSSSSISRQAALRRECAPPPARY